MKTNKEDVINIRPYKSYNDTQLYSLTANGVIIVSSIKQTVIDTIVAKQISFTDSEAIKKHIEYINL